MARADTRDSDTSAATLAITVVYSPRAGEVDVIELELPEGSSVADALRESRIGERHPQLDLPKVSVGVWGAFCDRDRVLRARDRVEVYRPLLVDAMQARRRRQQLQRAQAAANKKAAKSAKTGP